MYVDTHCHLYLTTKEAGSTGFTFNPEEVIKNSIDAGVVQIWLSSTNTEDIQKNIRIAKKFKNNIKVFIGFHPDEHEDFSKEYLEKVLNAHFSMINDQSIANPQSPKRYSELVSEEEPRTVSHKLSAVSPIIGIGEIGIDLYWNNKSTLNKQQSVFEDQIKIAKKYNLPFAVHSRDGYEETLEVLKKHTDSKFIWHSYTLKKPQTEYLLSNFPNIYFGFNSIITYKSGEYIQDSIKMVPNGKILLETDAPFLAPRPFKYKYNTSEGVIDVYRFVSKLKGMSLESLKSQLIENCSRYKDIKMFA